MKLSAPPHRLKQRARTLSREQGIPLNKALNRIAQEEGFRSWSLLAARTSGLPSARDLLAQLSPGDLVLLAARPGQGKTMMGLELIAEAIRRAIGLRSSLWNTLRMMSLIAFEPSMRISHRSRIDLSSMIRMASTPTA